MTSNPTIVLDDVKVVDNTIEYSFSFDEELAPYFTGNNLRVKYDVSVEDVPEGILSIPFVVSVIPVAWIRGANIRLSHLDKNFIMAIREIQGTYMKWYSHLPFGTELVVGKEETNTFSRGKTGLLFSGGVDSLTTFLRNRERLPLFIMVRGVPALAMDYDPYWMKIGRLMTEFSKKVGTKLSAIESTGVSLIQTRRLTEEAHFKGKGDTIWDALYFGLFLIATTAPLTVAKGLGTLLFAASQTKDTASPWGSTPITDQLLRWGDLRVIHDSFDLSRQQKIRTVLAPYFRSLDNQYVPIKVCGSGYFKRVGPTVLNCGKCEKCSRTITGLILEGIDPKLHGFDMDSFGFPKLKKRLKADPLKRPMKLWTDLQRHAKDGLGGDLYDSKEFFEWFSGYDFKRSLSSRIISFSIPENSKRRRMVRRIRRSSR